MSSSDEDRMRNMMDRAKSQDQSISEDWESFRNRAHRRLFMNRALISGVAVLFFAAGITAGAFILRDDAPKSQNILPVSTNEPSAEPEASPVETTVGIQEVPAEIWFTQEEMLSRVIQDVQVTEGDVSQLKIAMAAASYLLDGSPPPDGFGTAIPEGLDEYGYGFSWDGETSASGEVRSGAVTVKLPTNDFESGGGSLSMRMRIAQIVFTLTQAPEVDGVRFELDGELRDSLGGEGVDTSHPLTRADFGEDIQPPITVEYPKPGTAVTSPVMISGTADVFEANVNIRILDENGEVLAETFVTATCGTGCRGTYEKNVKFTVDHEQEGIVEVLTYSMEDGSPMWAVQTPVTLLPS